MKILLGIGLLVLLWGCKYVKKNDSMEDKFYKSEGSWDVIRIPMIKPYELLKLNGKNEWSMNLESPGSVSNIKGINIVQSIIIIHAGETYCNNANVPEAWFVIIPNKNIEKGFEKNEDFNKYLSSLQLNALNFYIPDKVYESFKKNKTINWDIPDK